MTTVTVTEARKARSARFQALAAQAMQNVQQKAADRAALVLATTASERQTAYALAA